MKIVIRLKDMATLNRINEYGIALASIGDGNIHSDEFNDVVKSIRMED